MHRIPKTHARKIKKAVPEIRRLVEAFNGMDLTSPSARTLLSAIHMELVEIHETLDSARFRLASFREDKSEKWLKSERGTAHGRWFKAIELTAHAAGNHVYEASDFDELMRGLAEYDEEDQPPALEIYSFLDALEAIPVEPKYEGAVAA